MVVTEPHVADSLITLSTLPLPPHFMNNLLISGPHVDVPTCFIEIGSTENEWGIPSLGEFWADLLLDHFCEWDHENKSSVQQQDGKSTDTDSLDSNVVVMSIGGGHYVPKLNDAARLGKGLHIGHALASYTLQVGTS